MKIEHIAIWARDLEELKNFYEKYFDGKPGARYGNDAKQFTSYFIHFEKGARLEIMHMPSVSDTGNIEGRLSAGLAHIAFSAGSEEAVRRLTERLRHDGFNVIDGPRKTGDGYFESVVMDPENNRIEIAI
jgi:lactoylglutathione lyase